MVTPCADGIVQSGFSEQILASQGVINIGGLKSADTQPAVTQIVNPALLQEATSYDSNVSLLVQVCNKLVQAVASHHDPAPQEGMVWIVA